MDAYIDRLPSGRSYRSLGARPWHIVPWGWIAVALLLGLLASRPVPSIDKQLTPQLAQTIDQSPESLSEVIVRAAEPHYVAPTRRDRIGRIWAPVLINGRGPFRLVLDSGASRSGIVAPVAAALSLPMDATHRYLLRGVTGATPVSVAHIKSFEVGDMALKTSELPIITDALGGADGVLGTDELANDRITVDFQRDLIVISRSHNEAAPSGYMTIPFQIIHGNLVAIDASVGRIPTKAIIDTGGQVTIANTALRKALERRRHDLQTWPREIVGVTTDVQEADAAYTPPLVIDSGDSRHNIEIKYADVTFGNMRIFEHWHMTDEPAMLVGMDALGLLQTLIIDYRRHELQILMPDRY